MSFHQAQRRARQAEEQRTSGGWLAALPAQPTPLPAGHGGRMSAAAPPWEPHASHPLDFVGCRAAGPYPGASEFVDSLYGCR